MKFVKCNQCQLECSGRCVQTDKPEPYGSCEDFIPIDRDLYLQDAVDYIDAFIPKSKSKHFVIKDNNREDRTLNFYYAGLINDCVQELQNGNEAYCFKIEQLVDIMKFVTEIKASYESEGIIKLIQRSSQNVSCED